MAHIDTHDLASACQCKRCTEPSYLILMNLGICKKHWEECCESSGPVSVSFAGKLPVQKKKLLIENYDAAHQSR